MGKFFGIRFFFLMAFILIFSSPAAFAAQKDCAGSLTKVSDLKDGQTDPQDSEFSDSALLLDSPFVDSLKKIYNLKHAAKKQNAKEFNELISAGTQLVQFSRAALTEEDILLSLNRFEEDFKKLEGTPYALDSTLLEQVRTIAQKQLLPFHLPEPQPLPEDLDVISKKIAAQFRELGNGSVRYPLVVEMPRGRFYATHPDREPEIKFVIHPKALPNLGLKGFQGFIDEWIKGNIDILGEGAIRKMLTMTASSQNNSKQTFIGKAEQTFRELFTVTNKYIEQAQANAQFHYGNPTVLFRVMLGNVMKYSEGYFGPDKAISVDEAQLRSLEYFASSGMNLVKKRTKNGEKIFWGEVGGGWMPQGLYTTLNWPNVDFTNIGRVKSQDRVGEALIKANGLQDRLRVVPGDARDLNNPEYRRKFDIIHQAGVLEHAGPKQLEEWIAGFANAVKPNGYLLFSNMTYPTRNPVFVEPVTGKHFFPGGTMVSEGAAAQLFRKYGFVLVWKRRRNDDYALALDHWAKNFGKYWPLMQKLDPDHFDEHMYRAWQLYVEGSAMALGSASRSANLTLEHYLLQKGGDTPPGSRPSLAHLSEIDQKRPPSFDEIVNNLETRQIPLFYDQLSDEEKERLALDRDLPQKGRVGHPFPLEVMKNLLRALSKSKSQ